MFAKPGKEIPRKRFIQPWNSFRKVYQLPDPSTSSQNHVHECLTLPSWEIPKKRIGVWISLTLMGSCFLHKQLPFTPAHAVLPHRCHPQGTAHSLGHSEVQVLAPARTCSICKMGKPLHVGVIAFVFWSWVQSRPCTCLAGLTLGSRFALCTSVFVSFLWDKNLCLI